MIFVYNRGKQNNTTGGGGRGVYMYRCDLGEKRSGQTKDRVCGIVNLNPVSKHPASSFTHCSIYSYLDWISKHFNLIYVTVSRRALSLRNTTSLLPHCLFVTCINHHQWALNQRVFVVVGNKSQNSNYQLQWGEI